MLTYNFEKSKLSNFGIGCLTIDEAAALIAKCLFFEGELEISWENHDDIHSIFDPKLDKVLRKDISRFRDRLISAVVDSTLKAEKIQRDFDESIIAEETFIQDEVLEEWLQERGIELGDHYADYVDFQSDLFFHIQKSIEAEYLKKTKPALQEQCKNLNESDYLIMFEKIARLEKELSKRTDDEEKPLSARERDSLLKLAIGMAVSGYAYDPEKSRNSAIGELEKDLQSLGIPLDQDTIRKWLKEAAQLLPPEKENNK